MILQTDNLSRTYITGAGKSIEVLTNVNMHVAKGETVAITGSSGSGKTTLLSLLAGLDYPTSGKVEIEGNDLSKMTEDELTQFRSQNIGFVFQNFYLLPHFTALENVSMPLDIQGVRDSGKTAKEILEKVGLGERLYSMPSKLSGGECQRVAIARSLATSPALIFADEPTGNLDVDTGHVISDLLFDLVKSENMTMVLVTHNPELADKCNRHLKLVKGNLK